MKMKLNYWQAALLFLPIILGMVILDLPQTDFSGWIHASAIANFLLVLGFCVPVYYQTYLALGFDKQSPKKSTIFKVNALVPTVYFTLYLLYIIYLTFIKPSIHHDTRVKGPIGIAHYNNSAWIVIIFMIHAGITFLFVNNKYVATVIKKITDPHEQAQLKADFLIPMRVLVRTAIFIYAAAILVFFVTDIIRFSLGQ